MYIYLQMIESLADKEKFEYIFKRYKKHMHYVAFGILKNKYDTEDAVHNAFLYIASNIKTIRIENSSELFAFVTLLAKHRAYDIRDSKNKYVSMEQDNPVLSYEAALPGDHGLGDALSALSPRHRELLIMKFAMGYTTREIADALGMKLNTVQKMMKKAKDELAKQLEKDCETI